jgi:hypothetical protein
MPPTRIDTRSSFVSENSLVTIAPNPPAPPTLPKSAPVPPPPPIAVIVYTPVAGTVYVTTAPEYPITVSALPTPAASKIIPVYANDFRTRIFSPFPFGASKSAKPLDPSHAHTLPRILN